jgi:hypothetical protein
MSQCTFLTNVDDLALYIISYSTVLTVLHFAATNWVKCLFTNLILLFVCFACSGEHIHFLRIQTQIRDYYLVGPVHDLPLYMSACLSINPLSYSFCWRY